jgi:uncharacterized UPF0160 family protein
MMLIKLFKMVSNKQMHSEVPYVSKISDSLSVMGSENKQKLEEAKTAHSGPIIGTHSGTFHCDEVLACTMLLYT